MNPLFVKINRVRTACFCFVVSATVGLSFGMITAPAIAQKAGDAGYSQYSQKRIQKKTLPRYSYTKKSVQNKKRVAKTALPLPVETSINGEALRGFYSGAAFVVDKTTNRVIYEKNKDKVVPIASLSKLMTAMVVMDAGLDMNEALEIAEDDVDTVKNSRSRLFVGLRLRRTDAMLLALMSSDNRAAHALGRNFPGGLPAFVAAMNKKAKLLGMTRTQFEEPTGLSSNNVSTPQDLAMMVAAAETYPLIRHYSITRSAEVRLEKRIMRFSNTNPLIKNATDTNLDILLSKTGHIREAGFCLVMAAIVDSHPVTVVLLDAGSKAKRYRDISNIQNWLRVAI